jgi:FkbM family methyltransferase
MIEVGAFDGNDSLQYHKRGFEVITFEPCDYLAKNLKEKTKDLINYTVIQKAVSDFNGKTIFNECRHGGASSILKFKENSELEKHWSSGRTDIQYSGKSYEVDVIRLDDFLYSRGLNNKIIDFLHIELKVLI